LDIVVVTDLNRRKLACFESYRLHLFKLQFRE
jgi:hypothetical protein